MFFVFCFLFFVLSFNNVNSAGGSSPNSSNLSLSVSITIGAVFAIGLAVGFYIQKRRVTKLLQSEDELAQTPSAIVALE